MDIDQQTPWGGIGYITFKRTYARRLKEDDANSPTEEFYQVIQRELQACEKQLGLKFSSKEKELYFNTRIQLKWSVAGRFMWQLGTKTVDELGLPSLQNCFSRDTKFITDRGIRSFEDFSSGDKVKVKGNLSWKNAAVKCFGKQPLVKLKVRRGKSGVIETIKTTLDHRWIISDEENRSKIIKTTAQLEKGMFLRKTSQKTNLHKLKMCNVGQQHGLVYGDGHYNTGAKCCAFVPCGDSIQEYRNIFHNPGGGGKEISGLPNTWKILPSFDMNKHYIYGFLAGWFAADGSVMKDGQLVLCNKSREVLEQAKGLFSLLDIHCGMIRESKSTNTFVEGEYTLYKITIYKDNLNSDFLLLKKHKIRWREYQERQLWKVVEVSDVIGEEEVWCVVEKEKEEFTLANGILTKNCAGIVVDTPVRPFTWAMEMLMLGSGVGYNIQKEHVYQLPKLKKKLKIKRLDTADADYIVPDTREGWIKLVGKVLKAHFYRGKGFTYSTQLVRSKGAPIKGFGGLASGPEDLCWGVNEIHKILNERARQKLRPIDCLDIMNIIGAVVVSGNVRRSAQLAIGDSDDLEFLRAKRWDLGKIPNWRNMSNNSVACEDIGLLPQEFWDTYEQGEPYGLINLQLSRKIGRTGEYKYPDHDVVVYNPCAEQSLHNYETCCLAEIFLPNIVSYSELIEVIGLSYKVNKHSLSLKCSLEETEKVVNANMRMGIGVTGVLQASEEQRSWLKDAYVWLRDYDEKYSTKNNFPASIKLTTVKPSGTLSLLAGVTPGVHPNPAGPYYIRRIRIATNSGLLAVCKAHGYYIEPQMNFDGTKDKTTMVVSFPCKVPEGTPVAGDCDWKEQLEMVRRMQAEWSDNSVSCTVYYKKGDLKGIKKYLSTYYKENFKTLSFLLEEEHGFDQAPYETISKKEYDKMVSKVRPITSVEIDEEDFDITDCETGACPVK